MIRGLPRPIKRPSPMSAREEEKGKKHRWSVEIRREAAGEHNKLSKNKGA